MWELTVGALAAAIVSAGGVTLLERRRAARTLEGARRDAEAAVRAAQDDARAMRERLMTEARGRATEIRTTLVGELDAVRAGLDAEEVRLEGREKALARRAEELEQREADLEAQSQTVQERRTATAAAEQSLVELNRQAEDRVARSAGRTREESAQLVREELLEAARLGAGKAARLREEIARAQSEGEARRLIDLAAQRYGAALPTERLVSTVTLPRPGRLRERLMAEQGLLRALTGLTEVEFHPVGEEDTLYLGAPDPYTREVGRRAYERLVAERDPNEQMLAKLVQRTRADLEKVVRTAGQRAADVLGLAPLHGEIRLLVGKLLYRTSYTQNQWSHAIETAYLCGVIADELGEDRQRARRAALIHDIGKVLWAETEATGSHAVSGAAFAREHGEPAEIRHAVAAHHDDEKPASVLAHLVAAADALSGARPGARRETEEAFSTRVEDLERICEDFDGIERAFVIQGGRELRIVVDQSRLDDLGAARLSGDVARRIEAECTYPGQIKVTVIRESRATAVAR